MATTSCAAGGDGVYPFKGRLDLVGGVLELSLKTKEGQAHLQVDRDPDGSYRTLLDVEDIHTPFFEMTTQVSGVVRVEKDTSEDHEFSGRFESQNTRINGRSGPEVSGNFDLDEGSFYVRDLAWGGLRGSGKIDLRPPYPVGSKVQLYGMDIADLLNWLAGKDKKWTGNGEISGSIEISGAMNKLTVNANLVSQNGSIEELPYDLLSLHLEGIYPVVDLTSSTVTKTNGFSVGLAGIVDLSDADTMASQIKAVKRIPLVKDNDSRSEWVLKRVQDSSGEGKTQTSLFLKNDKQNTLLGQEDSSLLGVQKKIGF